MLELMILGFLAEGPLHGYELRRKINELHGYAREVSDGSLYPAIQRLTRAGQITRRTDKGLGAAQRQTLQLAEAGKEALQQRLRGASGSDIRDLGRFLVVLAFLSQLPDVEERHAVLRRRLEFLDSPSSFFYEDGRPLRQSEIGDPYRKGMFVVAGAANRAERSWIREAIG